jgi:hypothetical protein
MTPLATLAASIKPTLSPDSRSSSRQTAAPGFFTRLSTAVAPAAATAQKTNAARNGLFASLMPAVTTVTATKVDAITDSVAAGGNNDGNLDPGEKITYTVTITDSGADAAGVVFNDTVHPHTTYVPNSLNASPLANNDTYETVGNTLLEVGPVASPSARPKIAVTGTVLTNDTDFLGDAAPTVKAPFPTTSTAGGTVSMAADGHFSFTPKEGFTGSDTFDYTITDDGADNIAGNADDLTGTATVTITVKAPRIWYVDNTAGAGGKGRSIDPFNTLAAAQTAANAAGDIVYVFTGSGNTGQNAGFTFQANSQQLLGEGVALQPVVTVNSVVNPVLRGAGSKPSIGNAGGNGVTATDKSGIIIRGLIIGGSTNAVAVTMNAAGGGATISQNTITGGTQNAIDVTTTATTVGGGSVDINNNTISGATLEGIDINASGTGTLVADVQNNGLTATGNAFDARTTAGALNLNFSNNPGIVSTGGSGVVISGLSGGALTVTNFANNSVSGASGANGVSITSATFDSNTGVGGLQALAAGTLNIGASGAGNGVGGNGLVLINVTGTLPLTTLNVFSDNGRGIDVTGLGAATTGLTASSGATISATNGAAVVISGTTIDLQNTVITSTNSPDFGVSLSSGINGTFSAVAGSSITNAAGDDFAVGSGTANITWNAPLSNSGAGNSVDVTGHQGGTVAFNGAITDTGQGINLNSNSGTTINFTGQLTLTTTTNAAFTATGAGPAATTGGTVTATVTTNTITTTTGIGLNVANTTIGAGGLKFKSITVGTGASGPATSGIILNNTGVSGSLVVSGDGNASLGGNDSGGIIQRATQYGISLTSTLSPSFTNMNIHDIGRNCVDGFKVTNFTFANGKTAICGTASLAGDFEVNNIAFVDRTGANDNTIDGTVSITNSTITDPERNAIMIETWAGTIDSINISNNTLSGGATNARIQDAIHVFSQGSATGTGNITTGTIQNNNISDFRFFDTAPAIDVWIGGNGIRVVGGNPNAASTSATLGTVANPFVISGNDIDNVGSNMIAVTFAGKQGLSNFTIQNNGTNADKMTNAEGNGISVFFGGNGTFNALVDNNWIDNIDQGGNPSGSKGIAVQSDFGLVQNSDVTNSNMTVSNNHVSNTAGDGIQVTGINNAGTFNVKVNDNAVTTVPDLDARYGIRVQQSNVGTQPTLNLEMHGNSTVGAFNAFHVLGSGIGIRKQDPYQFGIEGLSPTPTNSPEAYINSQNPAGAGTDKLAGTGFIAQNVALYKPENNQTEYTARADSHLQNSNINSLFPVLNISHEFASTLVNISQNAKPASAKRATVNAKPAQAPARGSFLDATLALMKKGSQATSPTANHTASEAAAFRDTSVALAHAGGGSSSSKRDLSAGKSRGMVQPSREAKTAKAHASASAFMPSGEALSAVNIGALKVGQSVTIQFQVILDNPPNLDPADLVGGPHVRNQGFVTYTGGPGGGVPTDDTAVGGSSDPTDTPVDLYDSQTTVITSNNNSSQGESIVFTATVAQNQAGSPGTPTGTVQFFDGANPITCDEGSTSTQPLSGGTATCTTSGLTPGAAKTIKAQYNGDGNFDTSFGTVSQTVIACSINPVVTSTADSGPNTLRDAVTNICLAPNNNVTFNLGAGSHTITLLSTLVIAKNINITNTLSGTNGPLTISAGNFGAFRAESPVTSASLNGLTVTGANATGVNGGGILVQSGTVTLTNMLFTGNTVINGGGGALAVTSGATLNVRNTTVSGNSATFGGGIYNNGGTLNLLNVTVTNNLASGNVGGGPVGGPGAVGGGIETGAGIATNIKNSIVAGNSATTGTNISGTVTDQGNNILTGDAKIAVLASNGGLTQTHALLPGSPALDAGDDAASDGAGLTTDQRGAGYLRKRDAASDADTTQTVDIGAFEADPSVEDITDKSTTEDTPLPQFSFGVGDAATAFTSITAVATTNPGLVSTITVGAGANSSLRTLDITPAANQSGTAIITVTVTKTIGGSPVSMSDTFQLTVGEVNDAPIAGNDTLSSVAEDSGQRIVLFSTLLVNDSPPTTENTQTISVTSISNPVGGVATLDIPNSRVLFTPNPDFNGTAGFDYTITDNGTTNGSPDPKTATATASFTVTEVNDTPVPANDTLSGVGEDSGQTIIPFSAVTGNDSRGALNESAQTLVVSSISNPVGGTFILDSPNSRVLFTPNADFNGTASFDYKVTDNGTTNGAGDFKTSVGSATAGVPVGDVNDAPTAVGENISSAAEDSGQRIILYTDILGNDIKGPANESAQTLVVKTVSSPVGGTVTNDPANSRVLFTPTADFNGAASFQYTIEDNGTTNGVADPKTSANTVTTTFTITEVNDAPDAVNDTLSSVAEDSGQRTITIASLLGNDSKGAANESAQTLTFALVAASEVGGTISSDATNVYFTPAADFNGTASFQYKITDNGTTAGSPDAKNDTATVSFTVTEVNDAPVPANDTLTNVAEDTGLRVIPFTDLTGNDSKGPANENGQTLIVKTVTNPVGGTVQINGTNVEFTPTANFSGTAGFDYTIEDNGTTNGGADPLSSVGTATVSFTITDENDAPVNTVPGGVSTPQNSVFTFAGGNQISITDIDAGASAVKVTLTATNGTISLSGIAGLSFTTGDGTADATMTFTGTVAAINTALNNLRFTPTTNFNGAASLQIVTNDQGNTGGGGAKSDTDTVNITVDPLQAIYINEVLFNPPGTDAPNEYIELRGTPNSLIPAGTYLVVIDGDSGNTGDVKVTINLSGLSFGSNGFLVILQQGNTYTTASGATVITGTTTGFGGLAGSIFAADGGATDLENDSVTFMLIQTGVAPTLTDNIDANNDGAPDGSVYAGWNVRDSIGILDGTSASDRAYGAINFSNNTGTNGTATGTTILESFTAGYVGRIGDSTGSTAADLVASVPAGAQPNFTLGTPSQTAPTNFAGKPLNHIGASNFVNLPPVNSVPASVNAVEDTTFTFNGGNTISISDPDANAAPVKVTLTVTNGTISLNGTAGLTFSPVGANNDGSNDTTLSFTGTTTAINTALNGMTFTPTTNFFGAASLQIVTDDQGNTGVGGALTDTDSTTINVGGINDAPTLDALNNATINEDATTQTVNLSGITAGPGESQTLSVTAVSSNTGIIPNPTVTYTSPNTTGSLSYAPVANKNGGPVTITVTVTDNGGTAGGGINSFQRTFTVTVTAVNDAPIFQIPGGNPPTVNEDAPAQTVAAFTGGFQGGPATATDEAGQTLVGYTVTANGTTGNLTFTSGPSINNAGTLTYTPTGNTSGTATFNVTAKDNGGTANGGQDTSAPVSFTITVTGQNDAPVLDNTGNMTLSAINEDNVSNNGTLVSGIIASAEPPDRITDVDASALEGIAVTGVDNTNGTWQFTIDNGTNWTPFGAPSVTTARLLAANANTRVRFVPASNFNGTVNTGITFRAWDQTSGTNGNTADPSTNGGTTAFSTATETAGITVNPVNDAPTANAQLVGTNEDTPVGITLTGTDIETASGSLTYNVTVLPLHGTLTGTGANRTYTPNPDYNGSDSFQFTVTDTGDGASPALTSAAATVTINVGAVNDAPVANPQSVSTNEDTAKAITLSGTDIDTPQGSLSFIIVTGPAHGTINPGASPNRTYTPTGNYNGPDSFTFKINDGSADSNTATVTITVNPVNDTPTADAQAVSTNEDTPKAITLSGSDTETAQANLVFNVTVQPTHGVLTGTGANRTYTPTGDYNGPDSFKFTATDTGDGSSPALTSAEATVSITVNAVNDAPVNTVPGAQSVVKNGALPFSAANSNLIAITDVDAGAGVMQVTLTVTNGLITLSGISGLSFTVGDGTNDPTMTFTGTISNINAALSGMTFSPTNGYDGPATLQISTNDQGNTGSGGAQSDTDTINITVLKGGVLQFSAATYTVSEGGGTVAITVTRTDGSVGTSHVDYATANGTATAGSDYTATSGQLTFDPGVTTQTFNVPITNDTIDELDETVNLTLSNVTGSSNLGAQTTAVLTITDNDPTPSLAINDVTVTEGNSGTVNATFTVTLSAASGLPVSVNYQTADGTATAPSDYTAIASTALNFAPGETTKSITVVVNGDTLAEADENFFVNLSGATNAAIADSQGVGAIVSDDTPIIEFSSSTYSVNEDGLRVFVRVNRKGDLNKVATVDYATSDPSGLNNCDQVTGQASSRCDYATTVGTLRFAAGDTFKDISIPIVNDVYIEGGSEVFTITLSNVSNADLGTPTTATVTINDSDNGLEPNPIDNDAFFIRQLYIDFLGREPEPGAVNNWLGILNHCAIPGDCDRAAVAQGFVRSAEFQGRGFFVYRFYSASLGRIPLYAEFIPDTAKVSGFLSTSDLEANKLAYIAEFMNRPEFKNLYDVTLNNPTAYVDKLLATSVLPNHPRRAEWIAGLTNNTLTRAQVLRQFVESTEVFTKYVNEAFIVMNYFGFLRRNPDAAYQAWIQIFNQSNDDKGIISGFMNSAEYRHRFGQ